MTEKPTLYAIWVHWLDGQVSISKTTEIHCIRVEKPRRMQVGPNIGWKVAAKTEEIGLNIADYPF